jgi:hypothetical protein
MSRSRSGFREQNCQNFSNFSDVPYLYFTGTYRQTDRDGQTTRRTDRKKERKREREREKKIIAVIKGLIGGVCVCVRVCVCACVCERESMMGSREHDGKKKSFRFSEQFPDFEIVPGFPRTNFREHIFRLEIWEQKIKFLGLVLGNGNGKIMALTMNIAYLTIDAH